MMARNETADSKLDIFYFTDPFWILPFLLCALYATKLQGEQSLESKQNNLLFGSVTKR